MEGHLDRAVRNVASEVVTLLEESFADPNPARCGKMFFSSKYGIDYDLVMIRGSDGVRAVAFLGTRIINWYGIDIVAVTVGPLAVHPCWRKRGLGRELISRVEERAVHLGAEAVYLQGISDFYGQFGYTPIPIRSKLKLSSGACKVVGSPVVRAVNPRDLSALMDVFRASTEGLFLSARRTPRIWSWLCTLASQTWYFSSPYVVEVDGKLIGYFCLDQIQPERVREFVTIQSTSAARTVLSGLVSKLAQLGRSGFLEIMTWETSAIVSAVIGYVDAEFIRQIRRDGGQLIKLTQLARPEIRHAPTNNDQSALSAGLINGPNPHGHYNAFIFQGDNF